LRLVSFNTNAHTSAVVGTYSGFPSTMAGITLDPALNLAVGVDFNGSASTPDTAVLFEVSNLSAPMLIARYNFPTNQQPNANHIGQTVFAGNKVWSLDANNGLTAFNIVPPTSQSPSLSATQSGSQVLVYWPATFTGWTLYSATSVTGLYNASEGTGTLAGGYYWVTNSVAGAPKYYRLAK
jgi:hypothetical protein